MPNISKDLQQLEEYVAYLRHLISAGGGGGTATTDASLLTSGKLPDARLSTNVAFKTDITPTTDASLLTSGLLDNTRLNSSVTKAGNTFNGNSQLVQTTAGGKLPVLDGSNLTNLPGADLSSYETASHASSTYATQAALSGKQATLVSGTTIKTINGTTLLGSGDITIAGGGSSTTLTDNLTTNTTGTALDAHQGSVVKGLIDTNTTAISTLQGQVSAIPLTPTGVKTANYTASPGDLVKTDATSGNITITLPAAPADKTRIAIKMIAVTGSNTTTIATGGSDVFNKTGGSTSASLSLLNQAVTLQYEAATGIWNAISSDIPLSQLDVRFATAAGLTTANSNITTNTTSITAINTRLQTETQSYLANIITAGGVVDAATIHAVDRLVAKWKLLTSWTKVTFISPMLGENLAAALVNLKYPAGLGILTNNNFVAADYTLNKGFYLTSNTTKYLQTGFLPTSQGATLTSFSAGCFITDNKDFTNNIIANNPASGTTNFIKSNSSFGIGAGLVAGAGLGSFAMSFNSTTLKGALSGVGSIDGSYTNSSALDTEITYYGGLYNASRIYATGGLGFVWFGTAMTVAELQDINMLVEELMKATGRMPLGPVWNFFGDSITDGKGLNGLSKCKDRFSHQVSIMMGVNELNLGCPTSEFRQTSAAAIAGNTRIQLLPNLPWITTNVIMYGTNDQLIGDTASTATANSTVVADFNNKYKVRIQGLQDAGQRVILISPIWNGTSAAAKQLSYRDTVVDVAKTQKCILIDGYNMLLDATFPATPTATDYFIADLVHPNAAGHYLMAQYIAEAARGRMVRRPTLDFPSIAAGGTATLTVYVGTALSGMGVEVTPPALEAGLIMLPPVVSTNDTVSITLYNSTAAAIDPASAKYYVAVKPNY